MSSKIRKTASDSNLVALLVLARSAKEALSKVIMTHTLKSTEADRLLREERKMDSLIWDVERECEDRDLPLIE